MITIVPTRVRWKRCSNLLNTHPVKNKSGDETIITQASGMRKIFQENEKMMQ
jgi:hypothetical protein